jgi:hypothetical protein
MYHSLFLRGQPRHLQRGKKYGKKKLKTHTIHAH